MEIGNADYASALAVARYRYDGARKMLRLQARLSRACFHSATPRSFAASSRVCVWCRVCVQCEGGGGGGCSGVWCGRCVGSGVAVGCGAGVWQWRVVCGVVCVVVWW